MFTRKRSRREKIRENLKQVMQRPRKMWLVVPDAAGQSTHIEPKKAFQVGLRFLWALDRHELVESLVVYRGEFTGTSQQKRRPAHFWKIGLLLPEQEKKEYPQAFVLAKDLYSQLLSMGSQHFSVHIYFGTVKDDRMHPEDLYFVHVNGSIHLGKNPFHISQGDQIRFWRRGR